MVKPCGLMKPCHLVKPVSATRVSGRYLTHQRGLPGLPVPPLQQTCERYIGALEPIVEVDELKHTNELVDEFQKAGGIGERLQRGLEKRASNTENWLSEWWVQVAYLEYRLPVVVHSSPGLVLLVFNGGACMFCSETLPVEYLGGKPLCMNQYYEVLSSCRIPGLKRDSIVNHAKSSRPCKHITVVHNFQFFVLDVYNSDGTPLTSDQLCVQLERICSSSPQADVEPVGILTTHHRDSWGKAYVNLIKDKTNKESVSAIQRSIFTLCLDGAMPRVSDDTYRSSAAVQMLHGGGSQWNSGNRWFDKTLQFIIGEDGTCGANYEHAPAEGPPIVALIDHVVEYTRKPEMVRSPMVPLHMPRKLHFNITPEIKKDIEEANILILMKSLNSENCFTHVSKYFSLSGFIHKGHDDSATASMLELFSHPLSSCVGRMYKCCCATYESASLRMFRLGRTDTIRSASSASASFVKAFDEPGKQNTEKVDLLVNAVKAHRSYTNIAISGQAIDRHLLGLKMVAIEEKLPIPAIFTDTAYAKALHYRLSTSQVPSKTDCVMCFGPVVSDGYGVCYNPMNDHINFAVSSFNTCEETSAARLARAVEGALLDMRTLLEQTPRAKL
uniref:Carnitine O-acetyltransferase a n=1 Tax=Dicentrarchus labrax TaxID=13489 RepID=A0A8P4GC68_DICLA